MHLKPVKSFFWILVIGLGLVSCDNESTEPEPEAEKKYYPVSVTRTASYTSDIFRSDFTYNAASQVEREMVYKNDALQTRILFSYDATGKLTGKNFYSETGQLIEQENITYDPAGLPDRLSHAYVDANQQPTPHHYRLHEFNAEGKISKWADHKPDGTVINSRTYTYENSTKVISAAYDNMGQHQNTSEISLDQKSRPFQHTTINLAPYTGNELKHEIKNLNGQLISVYTNSIIYNAAGYPEKITQTHADGTVKTETYTYRSN